MFMPKRSKGRVVASSICSVVEAMERRVLLHAGHDHGLAAELESLVQANGHVSAADFVRLRPQFAGMNLFDPAVFNPTNSPNSKDWLYDPHFIEDDRKFEFPPAPATGGPDGQSLPDIIPLGQNQGFLLPFLDTIRTSPATTCCASRPPSATWAQGR